MLHVVSGDEAAGRLTPARLPGEMVVWRDILVEGPVDADLDIVALAERRAPWLARRLGIPAEAYVANGRAQAAALARTHGEDEVVLWFEEDLFCATNLAYLAAWLARARRAGRVSLVFPAEPLGGMASATLATLFEARAAFTADAIAEAAAWWTAYCAPTPEAFATRAYARRLPFLDVAAGLHLARFPSTATGLGAIETLALAALDDTPRAIADIFRTVAEDARIRALGMTDLQLTAHLHALADGPTPLVRIADSPEHATITAAGRAVREGARDRLDCQALDWWLGGVHLEGRRVRWRWDDARRRMVAV